jgi:predicted transcriptional regulator
MQRKDHAADLLHQGLSPSEIAKQMGTSTAAVMQYLCLKIGEGELRRSDIAFSMPRELRIAIEEAIQQTGSTSSSVISRQLRTKGVNTNRLDIGVYIQYRRARVVLGDMYELLRSVEVRLHTFVKQAFILEFGEEQWWRSGVPDSIRAECAALLEKDPEPASEPYCYTHVISLREILDKRWSVLSKYMPAHLLNQKKELLERLLRLNRIRNSVMHPVRNSVISEEDFEFVRDLESDLADLQAHLRQEVSSEANSNGDFESNQSAPAPPELVTKLAAVVDQKPAPEEAATPGEVHDSGDFIPSTKVS